jgi:hypothetical protein
MLGKPNEGVHSTRFLGLAINDVLFTLIASFVIVHFTKWNSVINVFLVLNVIGFILHKVFCVDTALTRLLSF